MSENNYQAVVATPGFALGIRCSDDEITAIDFIEPRPEQAPSTPLAAETVRQLHAYLADPNFAFGLPLRPAGTAFQRRVWAQIAAIPNGQTHTYGQLAKQLKFGRQVLVLWGIVDDHHRTPGGCTALQLPLGCKHVE